MDPSRPHGPSAISTMKVLILTATAAPVLLFGVLAVAGLTFTRADALWIALPLIVGLADVVLVPAVGSTVRPLPYGANESDARRISVSALSTVTLLRFALAEAAALFGVLSAFLAGSLLPFAIGFVFAVPLLLLCAYPSTRVVDAIRERLESGGVSARFGEEPSHQP
jgi:hypothetical protein